MQREREYLDIGSDFRYKMDHKLYRIWRALIQMPHRWVDVQEVAHIADLTSRQVFAQIAHVPRDMILRRTDVLYKGDSSLKTPQIYLNVADEDMDLLKASVERAYYRISDDQIHMVRATLSSAGWLTLDDIAAETGLRKCDVTRTLSIMSGVTMKYFGAVQYYRTKEDFNVPEHI